MSIISYIDKNPPYLNSSDIHNYDEHIIMGKFDSG